MLPSRRGHVLWNVSDKVIILMLKSNFKNLPTVYHQSLFYQNIGRYCRNKGLFNLITTQGLVCC